MTHLKRILFLSCLLLLVAIDALAQLKVPQLSDWQRYTASDEEFSVTLPTLPAMDTQDIFIYTLRTTRRERQIGAYADGVVYVIFTYENSKTRQSLESFVEERNARYSTPVRAQRNLTVNGFAGKAFERETSIVQYFATEKHLYVFGADGAPADDPRVVKFFSSLRLGKKTEGKEVSDGPGLPFEPDGPSTGIAPTDPSPVYPGKEVDKKVRLGMKPEPRYTEAARMNAITGTVVLKCIFSANGMVKNIRIVSGLPYGLTEKSIDAAQKIKFIPAMKDGKYVGMWMQLEYNFNLY
jgi:TonB family protein